MSATSKKKSLIIVLAVALVAALTVTGTLMLFTDTSDEATNVVTLGDIKVKMQERGYWYPPYYGEVWQTIGDIYSGEQDTPNQYFPDGDYDAATGRFKGIKPPEKIMPGSKFYKYPRVANTGKNPFYTAINGVVKFKKGEDQLDSTSASAIINETLVNTGKPWSELLGLSDTDISSLPLDKLQAKKNNVFFELVFESATRDFYWYCDDVTTSGGALYSTWYYIEGGSTFGDGIPTLKVVPISPSSENPSTSESLFDMPITIPLELGNEAKDVMISIELTAVAVQSDNIKLPEVTGYSNIKDFFDNAGLGNTP
jgi:predicted ribosomally synthesized peptide with SipW-like signal peptide